MKIFLVSTLAIMLAVILVCYYLVKRFLPRGGGLISGNQWLRVIATAPLAHKKVISLVEVGEEILVLGLTDSHITLLSRIDDEQVINRFKTSQEKRGVSAPFYKQLKGLVGRYDCEGEKKETLVSTLENGEPIESGPLARGNR